MVQAPLAKRYANLFQISHQVNSTKLRVDRLPFSLSLSVKLNDQ